MLLEPPFDAPVASATAPEPGLEQQLERYVRASQGAFSTNTERAVKSARGNF